MAKKHEKTLSITNHQGNTHPNHGETPPTPTGMTTRKKTRK